MEAERSIRPRVAPRPARARRERAVDRPHVPGNDFVDRLRGEVRRSMRSGAALSIVVYCVGSSATSDAGDRLLEVLHTGKRETDLLGHVDDDLVAVLCPDTGADGLRAFTAKISERCRGDVDEVASATFPDPLFERLMAGQGAGLANRGGSKAQMDEWRNDRLTTYPGKRLLDIAGSGVLLLLLAPVLITIAVLVKLLSPGPAIYRQTRLGHGGRPFTFYKFRSMVVHSDDAKHREFVAKFVAGENATSGAAGMPFKMKADPRITRLGAFLRRSSLDELPQLYNVFKGDMSLVGPRPAIPYEVEHYQAWHLRRILTVRPGITGMWQVEGRSRVTFDEMVRMDLRYIRDCSLVLDVRLLFKTVGAVCRADGAA